MIAEKRVITCPENYKKGRVVRLLNTDHTQSAAERVLRANVFCQSDDIIRLTKFQKTDGQTLDFLGVKIYELRYKAEIMFTEDARWEKGIVGEWTYVAEKRYTEKKRKWWSNETKFNVYKIRGIIQFEKTEKGWWGHPSFTTER